MTMGKKRSQPDGGTDTSSKRPRLEYGATVTIKVGRTIRPMVPKAEPSTDSRTFTVYQDLISRSSAHFQREISRNRGRTTFDLSEVDPEEFKTYLDWLHESTLDVEMAEGGSARMLRKLLKNPDIMARYRAAIMFRLCQLLTMNAAHIQDDEFAADIEALLESRVNECENHKVHLTLTQGQKIWSTLSKSSRELQPIVVKWMAATVSPDSLEASRHSLSTRLFDAIQRALPKPKAIEVTVGQFPHEKTFTVTEQQILGHSRLMERVLSGKMSTRYKLLLADESPACFKLYLDYISTDHSELFKLMKYRYVNALSGRAEPRSDAESRDLMHSFCEVWILASRLENPTLQNAIIDAIRPLGLTPSLRTTQMIMDRAINESGLRLWLRDTFAERFTEDSLAEMSANMTKELLLDVLQRSVQARDELLQGGATRFPRRPYHYYHEH